MRKFQNTTLISSIGCAVAIAVAAWPNAFHFATMCISMVFGHVLSILVFNIVVMYVYVKYLIPPTRHHHRQRDFRPLRFAHADTWPTLQQQRLQDNSKSSHPPIAPNSAEISEAFDELISYILRDFIDYWFVHVAGPSEISFRESIDRIIRSAALKLQQRIHETDLFSLLVNRLIPAVTQHISEFRNAEVSLRGRSLERSLTQSDELDLLLASQFRGGKLHSALTTAAMTTKPTEVVYLRQVIDRVLPYVVDPKELRSGPVRVIIRELVSCAVLQPIMDMIADPDFWNQTIDSYLGKAIREQKMVRKLREAINRHSKELGDIDIELMETNFGSMQSPRATSPQFGQEQALSDSEMGIHRRLQDINMGRRTFQDFLRMIEEETNLLELKRVRNDIVTQLRKKRALIYDRDPEEVIDGEKVQDIIVYLNRLSVAKKRTDKRIGVLTGDKKASRTQFFSARRKPSEYGPSFHQPFGFSLNDILKNTAGLSYFMEFMDRRGDMMKLQFWLIVEGFKNPESMSGHEQQKDDLTFLQDVKMVYEMYLSSAPHRLPVTKQLDDELLDAIKQAEECVARDSAEFHETVKDMREKLYSIQQHVFWQLEKEHFPYFKRSDLYFKYLATTPNSAPDTAPDRRSLDENRLYSRRTSAAEDHTRKLLSSTKGLSARPLERTTSDSLSKKKPWTMTSGNKKADSDTEVGESRLQKTRAQLHSEGSSRPARGHIRATSETPNLSVSRLFGRMTGDWWNIGEWPSSRRSDADNSSKRSSMHGSIQSIDTDDLTEDEGTLPEDNSIPSPNNGRQPLVRRNTLDAVEAELKSIIDNEDIEQEEKFTPTSQKRKTPPPPLLLYGTKGSKSSMALPVQNDYTLPTWKSSGGSNVIGEVQHDELEPIVDSNSSKSKVTQKDKADTDELNTLADSETLNGSSNVHLAPPGDLMLAAQVEKLSEEMEKLKQQEAIVDVLISKAEAKNKTEELRILKKSKNMFRRELQQIKYQKSQYELQESENVLMPERTCVSITSSTIGSDDSGEFALYVIEIQQLGADGNYASGWIVARRYSEFFSLHQKLKDKYPPVKNLEFPAKWPLLRLQKSFVEARRTNLERYLRRLVENRDICKSKELRTFLSQQNVYVPGPEADTDSSEMGFFTSIPLLTSRKSGGQHKTSSQLLKQQLHPSSSTSSVASTRSRKSFRRSSGDKNDGSPGIQRKPSVGFMKHIYKTVAEGIDDLSIEPSMLDVITQRMGEQVMDFIQEDTSKGYEENVDTAVAAAAAVAVDLAEVQLPADEVIKTEAVTTFTDPLCDLFIEMFELKDKNNWLRRQAVVIILQQILGGTIERKLRETVKFLGTEPMVVFYLRRITDSLWPDGQALKFRDPRRTDEKQLTKEAANRKLSTWLPDQIGQMVGRQNARRGARRLFSVLQNKRLNQDLAYTLFDEILSALFPEIDFEKDIKR